MLLLVAGALLTGPLPTKEIAPGVAMPVASIGTWDSGEKKFDAFEIVAKWLANGFRGIDTALVYLDQPRVAKAVSAAGLRREEIFLTSKIPGCQGSLLTKAAVEFDLKRLNTSYVDLMLMHSPFGFGCASTWAALEGLVQAGKLRSIGVSNFDGKDVDTMCANGGCRIPPAVNQIDYSVMHHDEATITDMRQRNITVEAYSPLGGTHGTKSVFSNPMVNQIAAQHNVSAAQVALRWIVQRGDVLTVLSGSTQHQANDADLWSFALAEDEMATLTALQSS